jgi:hypothetical protein
MILLPPKEINRCATQRNGTDVSPGTKLNIKYWIDDMLDTISRKKFNDHSWNT